MIDITIDQPAQTIALKIPNEMRQKLIDSMQAMSSESETFTLFITGDTFILSDNRGASS